MQFLARGRPHELLSLLGLLALGLAVGVLRGFLMIGRAFDEVTCAIEVVEWRRGVELFKLLRCDVLFVVEGSHLLGP